LFNLNEACNTEELALYYFWGNRTSAFLEQEEICKLHLLQIKKEEAEQAQKLETLERDRSRHAIELKLLQYQDASR